MAQTGEVIENPVTHDRVIFRVTAQETNGAFVAIDDFLLAGYISPPEHVHPRQQERFEVISGSLGVRINGREQVLHASESVAVPPGMLGKARRSCALPFNQRFKPRPFLRPCSPSPAMGKPTGWANPA